MCRGLAGVIHPKAVARCCGPTMSSSSSSLLIVDDKRFRKTISDYRNNSSDDTFDHNMGRGRGEGGGRGGGIGRWGRGGDARDLEFDDILQQLKRLSDEINKDLTDLDDPDLFSIQPKFRISFKSEPDFHHQLLSEFQSDLVSKSRTGFQSKFRSALVHQPSIYTKSDSTALADGRGVLPVKVAGGLRQSTDPSLCCFLPALKTQANSGRSCGKLSQKSQKSQKGASSNGQVVYNFFKSYSEEGCRQKGGGIRTSDGSQPQSAKCTPSAKHSLSYDESRSTALQRSSQPGSASPSVMDGILSSLQQTGQPGLLQSQISNHCTTSQDGLSRDQLTGGNRPPLKTFALDPTKYQLRSSERRNVPQMGRQRRNCLPCSNDSGYAILLEADQSNDDVPCRDNNTGLHDSPRIEVGNYKQNGGFIGTRWKDTTAAPSHPRALSIGSESGVAGHRAEGSSSKSSLASVSRHLSLETEPCERLQNLMGRDQMGRNQMGRDQMGRDQDTASSKLVSWMLGPDSPDYAVPFDTLVADLNVAKTSAKINAPAAFQPQKAGNGLQSVRTCRTSGINVTRVNESTMIVKPQMKDDTSISLKSYSADPNEPDAVKNLSHCAWKGDEPADKSDTLKARSPGICPPVTASCNWETRPVAVKERSIARVPPDKSSLPESIYSSQNLSGNGRQILCKGPGECARGSWNQSVPELQTTRDILANKSDKSSSASGFVNKVSGSKEPNTTRIQHGQLTNDLMNMNFNQQPTRKSEGSTPDHMHHKTPWDNMLVTENSGGDSPSDRRDLFRSSESVSVKNCLRHDFQSSSSCGRSGRSKSQRSDASTETLRDVGENENGVVRKDNHSVDSSASHSYGQSWLLNPEVSCDYDRSNDVFDQNNNQQFFEEDEEEFFGTSAGSTLDWCYKWEWDSPTSTLQRSIIRRPAYQRNNSDIPRMNNQTEQNADSSTTPSQEPNPDVIPMINPPPRLLSMKNRGHNFPGAKICYYIVSLAAESGFFGAMVKNFIQCTVTGVEMNPHTVIRNIRQFIDGLKNYLTQQREAKLDEFIKLECSKINSGEFLNLDAITERALHKCIVRPLHNHINKLFVYDFTRNGNLQLMADGMKSAKAKRIFDSVGPTSVVSQHSKSIQGAQHFLRRMTETYSPIKKLENLIAAVSIIAGNDTNSSNQTRWSADSTKPLRPDGLLMQLMYVLVDESMTSAEVEADYIWGLIHPSFLTGERTYYLTLFSSAVTLIKNLSKLSSPTTDNNCLQRIIASGLLRICIPDEKQDNTWTQTLPFQPNTTTADICQMMAYKLNITNPHEYSLYLINDGEESRLNDTANLSDIKTASHNKHLLAYKRISAKFIWPKNRH